MGIKALLGIFKKMKTQRLKKRLIRENFSSEKDSFESRIERIKNRLKKSQPSK